MKTFRLGLISFLVLIASVFGAAAQSETVEPNGGTRLSDSQWLLTATSGQDHQTLVLPGSGITLNFEGEDRISGNGGCNSYGGAYATRETGEITLSEIISTLIACADTQMTTQESIYLGALSGVTHYELTERQLTLHVGDVEALHFVRADQDALAGTSWQLISEVPADVAATPEVDSMAHPITLTFQADGQAVGNGGCNSYSATYALDGTSITFGAVVSTKMVCLSDDMMQREQDFFAALSSASQYGLTDERLYIQYAGGSRLAFEKADSSMTTQITVTPMSGAAGTEVTVSGSGFAANSTIVIGFGRFVGDVYNPVGEAQTSEDGTFSTTVTIPTTADPNEDWVFMAAVPGTARTLSDKFDVTGS